MNADECTSAVMRLVSDGVEAALSDFMTEKQSNMWELLSVPVQYRQKGGELLPRKPIRIGSAPGAPYYAKTPENPFDIIRSKPGEAPRKEFGNYYNSMKVAMRYSGDRITGVLGTDIQNGRVGPGRAPVLEFTLRRPHFRTIHDQIVSAGQPKLMQYLSNYLTREGGPAGISKTP